MSESLTIERTECDQLPGRLRALCRGETSDIDTCNAYRSKFGLPPLNATEWDITQPSRGLGDTVAKAVNRATFGLVKPCGGCKQRQSTLNRLVKYKPKSRPKRVAVQRALSALPPQPYTGPIVRDLIYHVWPTKRSDQWKWNLDQLLQRITLFNGRRIIGIVTDQNSHSAEVVQDYLSGHGCEYVLKPNDKTKGQRKGRGEVITFPEMLEMVRTNDPNRVAFYGHAKGVRYSQAELDSGSVRQWAAAQYEVMLDDFESVEAALLNNLFAGCFRAWIDNQGSRWQYSGTFWAMRSARVFANPVPPPEQKYGGVEVWPSKVASLEHAACLFVDSAGHLKLKDRRCFDSQIEPQLAEWRARCRGPVNVAPSVAFVTAAWGGYLEKFGRDWVAAIERMNPRPKDVVIVSKTELPNAPAWVRQFRPQSAVHNWDWFNEAVAHADAEWVVCVGIDDLFHANGLSRIRLDGDVVAFAHTHLGKLMAPTAEGYAGIIDRPDNPMYGGAAFRKDVFLRFPWRRVVYPDWYQWIEFRQAGTDVRCDPTPRFVWRRHREAHSANRHPHAVEQIAAIRRAIKAEQSPSPGES